MRDAFGGITSLVIIVVFLVLVSGYLAFNVNYTKAFKVKNRIITLFEQYEGSCGGTNLDNASASGRCNQEIKAYIDQVGYSAIIPRSQTAAGYTCVDAFGYCYKKVEVDTASDREQRAYFKIVTQITIDLPIVNRILPFLGDIFQVSGDTRTIIVTG